MKKRGLKYYMSLNYPVTVETYEENGESCFSLEIPDLPGCGADGKTIDEALSKLNDSKELWFRESLKRGLSIPEPVSEEDFRGKFLLRIPIRLHMNLSRNAKVNNLSLNQYLKSLLEKSLQIEQSEDQARKRDEMLLKAIEVLTQKIDAIENKLVYLETSLRPIPQQEGYTISNDSGITFYSGITDAAIDGLVGYGGNWGLASFARSAVGGSHGGSYCGEKEEEGFV